MTSEKKPRMLALEKYARWLEAHLGLLIGLIVWAAFILIFLFVDNMQLGDRIQAASMITLVFITLFYARQTQDLVKEERQALEEEKKKRQAEFGEKRIRDFLGPLGMMLRNFQDSLDFVGHTSAELTEKDFHAFLDNARKQVDNIEESFRAKMYMANDTYCGKIMQLMRAIRLSFWTIASWSDDEKAVWLNENDRELESIIGMLEVETHHISRQIQETYGDYAQKLIL